jgi:opacity protein-like surface antigen
MIKTVMSNSLIAALLLGGSGAAYSADLDNIMYAPQLPKTQPVEVGNGWYLRGDIGYNFSTDGSGGSDFDSDVTWGLGMGYQFNNWFRAEALATLMNGTLDGTSLSTTAPCAGGPAGTGCDIDASAGFTAYGVMANGYFDLGTYSGFTPYLGAGLGYTLVDYDGFTVDETCAGGGCLVGTTTTTSSGEKSWRFTYALMAGVAYEFARNWKVDVGYKYTDVDGGDMYGDVEDGGFQTHQILASLRYSLW